jgi:hypothetical protein
MPAITPGFLRHGLLVRTRYPFTLGRFIKTTYEGEIWTQEGAIAPGLEHMVTPSARWWNKTTGRWEPMPTHPTPTRPVSPLAIAA